MRVSNSVHTSISIGVGDSVWRACECVSVFTAVPSAVLVLSPLIGVCCIDSLVQQSDWHFDRWTEQDSRGKLVIGSAFCLSNCPLPLLPLCF